MMKWTLGFIAATVFAASAAAGTAEIVSGSADRESTAITVYNDDLALIKERRRITLPAGLSRLSLREVSAQLRPETAMLRAIYGRPLTLLEQNFDFDLLTPEKLLEKYVGREVSVLRVHPTTGEERREKATVLAASNGTVLRFADRIETGAPGRIVFDSVPATLRDRPTLSLLLEAAGGSQSLELSYLSGGLSWQADYVANLAADGKSMDLSAWVTLNNHSGASYEEASLQLVAGKLNRAAPARPLLAYAASALRAKAAEVAEESLLDYHLYSFERPTTIADNQSKQLALLSAAGIPVRRDYVLAGADYYYRERSGQIAEKIKPAVFIEFANKGGQLGKPLPAGVIRVYARDSKGGAQFVGEDRIGHTAKNENVRLKLGEAFDISVERKQTSYRKLGETSAESAFHLELRNARDEAVSVRIEEALPGDWEIVQETQKSTKESALLAVWNLSVPANGSATLDYTARVRW
ncbi:DUF4139 domain-containing protein [Rhodocyclus tenuis]|uniref:DUF4139 domain-containing protein n=1 Tax=Rhodocyclus tenuis TaxID=1066 RepID=A0A840G4U2_RHOTE|nr:DUF4139 domain-containing protein [Rhodocyclus tenuis]MBB4247403.1 hypothetical protein [Rhodocyclus tenuis]